MMWKKKQDSAQVKILKFQEELKELLRKYNLEIFPKMEMTIGVRERNNQPIKENS